MERGSQSCLREPGHREWPCVTLALETWTALSERPPAGTGRSHPREISGPKNSQCYPDIRVLHQISIIQQPSWGPADTRRRPEARLRGDSLRECFRGAAGPASPSLRPATWRTWTRCSASCYTGQCGSRDAARLGAEAGFGFGLLSAVGSGGSQRLAQRRSAPCGSEGTGL